MENENIPMYMYENEQARQERHIKRLWITNIILILALLLCNAAWIWFISHYHFESTDIAQDGEGVNIVGDSNEVNDSE